MICVFTALVAPAGIALCGATASISNCAGAIANAVLLNSGVQSSRGDWNGIAKAWEMRARKGAAVVESLPPGRNCIRIFRGSVSLFDLIDAVSKTTGASALDCARL